MGKVMGKICVRTEDEKRRILESCHAGIEGKTERIYYSAGYENFIPVFVHVGSHLGSDKTIQNRSSRFFWKNINEDIRILIQHCDN